MSGRHIALLVEDEPEMAKELGELLDSIGHDHVHVTNAEDGRRIVEEGEFCYVLLDLQIMAHPDSIKPHPEAGLSLLEFIREKYPRRNEGDMHQVPVLVVSGHAKEHYYVVKTLKDGADDFITKPVSESKPSFKDKIQDALNRSGRAKHEACADVMRKARGGGAQTTEVEAADCLPMTVTGQIIGKRTVVTLGDRTVPLTANSFHLVLRLVAGRGRAAGAGWVHKDDLGAKAEQGWKGVSRLKDELRGHIPPKLDLIENDKNGSYRLNPAVTVAGIDFPGLAAHWDARVTKLAAEIQRARAKA